ncbi:MAG: hypothetical protein EG822_14845 [Deltaproteobacteria bacterium]|nr:hypothetical protein [Deltaproteobacteria bacterium]TLN02073.1 MAG: hypothetical protein FDZ73_13275 [bacterium]
MTALIPSPDTFPAAWELFSFLLLLVFPLHLILMNAMVGTTAIAAFALLKKDQTLQGLAYELAKVIPFLIAFAVNLGVAALLFLQVAYGQFFYTGSIMMGVYWLSVVPLLLLAYYAAYLFDFKFSRLKKPLAIFLITLPLLIFLTIAFIYTNNMTLMLDPEAWQAYFTTRDGTLLHWGHTPLIPRYLHFITGGLAVGGLFVALLGKMRKRMDSAVRAAAERIGMKVFTALTGVSILAGFLFLVTLPRPHLLLFMGGDPVATGIFGLGLILSLVVVVAGARRKVWLCVGLVVPLMYLMSYLRDVVRTAYLEPYFRPELLPVVPQYGALVMFLAVLLAGAIAIAWMIRQAISAFNLTKP